LIETERAATYPRRLPGPSPPLAWQPGPPMKIPWFSPLAARRWTRHGLSSRRTQGSRC